MNEEIENRDPIIHGRDDRELDAVQTQLSSQRAGDNLQGMNQVRQWLRETPEDRGVYEILLNAVEEKHKMREQIRNLLLEMMGKGSKTAEEAMSLLPSSAQDLLADADDAYYATEYDRAIELYRQVLKLVPDNARAMEHLTKAKTSLETGDLETERPREAVQYYRRARSYLAGRDFVLAIKSLNAAVEACWVRGMEYPDAEELLDSAHDSLVADEFYQKANLAIKRGRWKDALASIHQGLSLQLADETIKRELGNLKFRIKLMRVGIWGAILLLVAGIVWFSAKGVVFPVTPVTMDTPTLISSPTDMVTMTAPATGTALPTVTATQIVASAPTPTPVIVLGYGMLRTNFFPLEESNGKRVQRLLDDGTLSDFLLYHRQSVIVVDSKDDRGDLWYKCIWKIDDIEGEGWILSETIEFIPPPTLTP